MTGIDAAGAVAALVAGFAAGLAFFALLRANVRLYLEEGRWQIGIALHVVRYGAVAAAFFVLARFGAAPLIAGLLGFTAARFVAVRRPEKAP